MNTYRLYYLWTERDTGGAHEVFVDVRAFTAADAVFQAELRITKESPRHFVSSGTAYERDQGVWVVDRYYNGIRRICPIADIVTADRDDVKVRRGWDLFYELWGDAQEKKYTKRKWADLQSILESQMPKAHERTSPPDPQPASIQPKRTGEDSFPDHSR